jgi:hypothetical protein
VETFFSIGALLCGGLCCLLALAGLFASIWIVARIGTAQPAATGEGRASASPAPQRALSTTPPDPRLGRPREPAAETAILPTPTPDSPSLRTSGDEDDMDTVAAKPTVVPLAAPPGPPRSAETPPPALPQTLGDAATAPDDPKKTPGPRSSGQTIIAFDDDDEDW